MKLTLFTALLLSLPLKAEVVTFVWDANPEPNVDKYTLKIGNATGVYSALYDVGKNTECKLDLSPGTYYAVVQVVSSTGTNVSPEISTTVELEPGPSPTLMIGDIVTTFENRVNVRKTFGLGGEWIVTMDEGAIGEVVGGPEFADGYIWWTIVWEDNTVGWSGEDLLSKFTIPPAEPPPTETYYTFQFSKDLINWEDVHTIVRPIGDKEFTRTKIEHK